MDDSIKSTELIKPNQSNQSNQLKVQYCSDIHLETHPSFQSPKHFKKIVIPVENVDVLVLAGDIFNPLTNQAESFMKYCVDNWPLVLFTPGNHEFYNNDYTKTVIHLYNLSKKLGFKIMEHNVHAIDDKKIVFIGCTLWSLIEKDSKEAYIILKSMNDYHLIKKNNVKFTIDDTNRLYHDACRFLIKNIEKYHQLNYKIIVISHHGPVMGKCTAPLYDNSPIQTAFESNTELIWKDMVDYWIFGHTHFTTKFVIGSTTFMANQYGYYKGETDYSLTESFDVDY